VTRPADTHRRRLLVDGIVQGVGFRPFVTNLAIDLQLTGFVTNTSDGVVIEIQGPAVSLESFAERLESDAPPLAMIVAVTSTAIEPDPGAGEFTIVASEDKPGTRTLIPPDTATCADCLHEMLNPADRRFGYPFTNCTNCGPRWTIIERIPYDRPFTSMAPFTMCAACQAEYDDPQDRRFHAQPNACPECGPRVWLEDHTGEINGRTDPLDAAAGLLSMGRILAVKGLGGFHLAVRADDPTAVDRLRERKHREGKPLAVMAADLDAAREFARVTETEADLMASPSAPIVLTTGRPGGPGALAESVAPGHRRLGLMLPYTPLHHLLFDRLAEHGVRALVMTSGNASDEPICLDNHEARVRLHTIADAWLVHDRGIVRRADDSVVQVLPDGPLFFRRSRGFAPVPVIMPGSRGLDVLAVGPELKNTVCLLKEDRGFLSPHIGDLENLAAFEFFTESIATLQEVLECMPAVVAHDLHPGYFSTDWARKQDATLVGVQHHHAHLAAVMAEHGRSEKTLGLIMDGTGYGTDGTIWGGEILAGDLRDFERLGHLETVPLPGGDAAVRAPWRTAVSYLRHTFGEDLPDLPWLADHPVAPVLEMLAKGVNSPLTSSCGRLFDAVAALTGRWSEARYEAQAAIELMALTDADAVAAAAPLTEELEVRGGAPFVLPTGGVIRGAVAALQEGADPAQLSARFHRTLIDLLIVAARAGRERTGLETVALGGGVFQNEILLQGLTAALGGEGFTVLGPRLLPANDGAISLGQAVVARARLAGD